MCIHCQIRHARKRSEGRLQWPGFLEVPRKSDQALASWKICNKLKPPLHCAKAGMPSLRPEGARHPRSLASCRHEVDGKSVCNQLEEISPPTSMCSPPHTDGAGRPRAVASAVSELVAKVADKMQHQLVGLGLFGRGRHRNERCPHFHKQTSCSTSR